MLRDYVKGAGVKRPQPKSTATPSPPPDPMPKLQEQWSKVITRCDSW